MTDEEIRLPLLQRLAEQAMSDPEFREVARVDLDRALEQYGYALNTTELTFARRFRNALQEAGIDLQLSKEIDLALSEGLTAESAERLGRFLEDAGTRKT